MSHLLSACSTPAQPGRAPATAPVVRLMALGGPMTDRARVERGVAALQSLGFQLDNLPALTRRESRFAGTVDERAADLNALADPSLPMPDLIMATRGGFGAIQLLDRLDYARLGPRLRAAGTLVMGYSDNTAVQLALLARAGVISLSGPVLYADFGASPLSAFTQQWLREVLTHDHYTLRIDVPQSMASGQLDGTLWGGNLSTLVSLVGTPYLPQPQDGLLFLEDVGEDVYKVDRMLEQLRLAGVLGRQRAILLGHFSAQRSDGFDPQGYSMATLANRLARQLGIPVLSGLPIGHVADIVPIPIGARGELRIDATGYTLNVSGYPALKRLPAAWTANAATTQ
ncbi:MULTISPECIES: LD-carboxypeptidase [unclassified Paludibacterium]|uniref:LD-carboxypeptidase n=1 Tax=unclassified Paludibacterium TaxID=2618429 RepID=UPI001C0493BE|nr:LD-carboxypeptidase [Paludibacterium sp. B53371]